MKHHDIQLTGSISVTGSLTVPVGTTDERPLNPKSGSLRMNTTTGVLEIYTAASGSAWVTVGEQIGLPPLSTDIEYLVVAGGGAGGGGGTGDYGGGGGGAGGYLSSSLSSMESGSSITVTIGSGGSYSSTNQGGDGGDSSIASAGGVSFTTVTSTGGGGGAVGDNNASNEIGRDGGSGGGGGYSGGSGGSGTVGQGNDGATNDTSGTGGGGGGAGAPADNTPTVGDAGDGKQSKITGTLTYYAGGGGGGDKGSETTTTFGSPGQGGGGKGASDYFPHNADPGTANTGGGGGGISTDDRAGASGGSGVVIFAYDDGSFNCAGGIVGDAGNGRKYHQFNVSSTFKVGSTSDFGVTTNNLELHLDAGDFGSRGTSTWTDLTANGYDSTLVSSPALGQNFYYDFDGSADYGTFASAVHTAISAHTQGTIECWVNGDTFTSGTGRKTIFGTGHSSQTDRWCVLRIHQTSNIQWSVNVDGTAYGCNSDTLPSTSTWYHLCLTFDGTTAKIYQNGVSQTITVASNGMRWFNAVGSDTLQVGAMDRGTSGNNYDPFDGKIAQLRVYSSALTEAQVVQNYEATKTNFV